MPNNENYCFIRLKEFTEEETGYNYVKNMIKRNKYLFIDGTTNNPNICFVMPNDNDPLMGVLPIIFIKDEINKIYIDPITNQTFSFEKLCKFGSIDEFRGTGELGDYIEPIDVPSDFNVQRFIREEVPLSKLNYYKDVIYELNRVITINGYQEFYRNNRTSGQQR